VRGNVYRETICFNFLYYSQELGTTLLLHDIRVPPPNTGSVHNKRGGVHQGNRFDSTAGSFICIVGELSSYSADSIQLRHSDEMGKLHEPGSDLVFGIFADMEGRCGSLGFDEENGLSRFNGSMTRVGNRAGTTCRSLCSGVLGCDHEMGGRDMEIIEPIERILDRLCVQQTRAFRDNVSWPRKMRTLT
jgi:hypothetical protein